MKKYQIVVYFTTGEVVYFSDVVNRRSVWRQVSKACRRWNARVDHLFELCGVCASDLNATYGTVAMHGTEVINNE